MGPDALGRVVALRGGHSAWITESPGQSPGVHATVSVHFVNNVLAAAASYIEEDPDTARDVLAELGAFLSHRLRGPRAVSPAEELDHVGVYLRLEQARFPGRIDVELPAASELPATHDRPRRRPGAAERGAQPLAGAAQPGRVRVALRARGDALDLQLDRPDEPGRGRRAPADPARAWRPRGACAMTLRPGDPRRRRRAARARPTSSACSRPRPRSSAWPPRRRPRRRSSTSRAGATTRSSSTSRCPRSRAWRWRACCGASPTRRPSSSSPATPTRRSRRSRSRRWTSWSSRSRASGSSRRSTRVEQHVRGAEAAKAAPSGDGAESAATGPDVVAVDNPKGGGKRLVRLETISFAQANGDYARIVCDDGRFLLRTPLSQLEKDWARDGLRARAPRVPRQPQARGRAARAAQRHRGAHHARRHRDPGRAPQRRRAAAPPARVAGATPGRPPVQSPATSRPRRR